MPTLHLHNEQLISSHLMRNSSS